MSPNAIIEYFNVLKDNPFSVFSGFKTIMMQAFSFNLPKKLSIGGLSQQLPFTTH
jgi:hypothetical protein